MSGYHIREALRGLGFLLCVAGLVLIVQRCTACADAPPPPALSPENAMAVKQYDEKIVECQQAARQKPKSERFEAFVDCERAVSRFFCEASPDLQAKWQRCQEVDR